MILIFMIIGQFSLYQATLATAETNQELIEIKVQESEFYLFVEAYFTFDEKVGKFPKRLSYHIVVEGISRDNEPNIYKAERNFFNPYEEMEKPVCVLKTETRDTLKISFKVKNGSATIAKEKMTWIRPEPIPLSSNKNPEFTVNRGNLSDIEIDGLIIDQTKTKAGRDFYELFYSNWTAPPQAKDFTILITEEPARGRSTIVSVKINEELVFRQFLQSRYEIVEQLMYQAIAASANKLLQLEEMKNQIEDGDQIGDGIF